MPHRKDGAQTRHRILQAACRVFGDMGYRDATHAEICRQAGVNSAAINYHFGSKDALYRATWEYIAEEADRLCPLDGGVAAAAPPCVRLKGHVRALLQRAMDERLADFHRIRMVEMVNPTGLLDDLLAQRFRANRRFTLGLVRELLGPRAGEGDIELCEMSLVSQCRIMRQHPPTLPPGDPATRTMTTRCRFWRFSVDDIDRLTDHITCFTLAGIEAIRHRKAKDALHD